MCDLFHLLLCRLLKHVIWVCMFGWLLFLFLKCYLQREENMLYPELCWLGAFYKNVIFYCRNVCEPRIEDKPVWHAAWHGVKCRKIRTFTSFLTTKSMTHSQSILVVVSRFVANGIAEACFSCCEIRGGDEREFRIKHLFLPGRCWWEMPHKYREIMFCPKSLGFFISKRTFQWGCLGSFVTVHPFR